MAESYYTEFKIVLNDPYTVSELREIIDQNVRVGITGTKEYDASEEFRPAFETWLDKQKLENRVRDINGKYNNERIQLLWLGYKAAKGF